MRRDQSVGYTRIPLLSGNDESDSEEELFEAGKQRNIKNHDKVSKVQHELNGAINVMRSNINKALNRGEKLEDLETKSEMFEMSAFQFKSTSTKLSNRLWWNNMKMKMLLAGIIFIGFIVLIVCIIVKNKK